MFRSLSTRASHLLACLMLCLVLAPGCAPKKSASGPAKIVIWSQMDPEERAREGVFLAFQYPVAIPGVTMVNFLRHALNAVRGQEVPVRPPRWRNPEGGKLKNLKFSEVIGNSQFRGLVDGEMDLAFRAYTATKLKRTEEEIHLEIVQLSTITHILTADLVFQMGEEAGREEDLVPPVDGLVEKIAEAAKDKRIEGISDIVDLTDGEKGTHLVIEVKNGIVPEALLEKLYAKTPLETSFGINNVALVDGQPHTLGLLRLLQVFLDHRFEVVRRRSQFRRNKKADRLHLVDTGLRLLPASVK